MSVRSDGSLAAAKAKSFTLVRAALSKKAFDPVLIRLHGLTAIADYFLIVSGSSGKQVQAIAEAVMEHCRHNQIDKLSSEGVQQGNWALLDYGDVIVHVFQPAVRDFYDLEGLWAEAPREAFPEDILEDIRATADHDEDDFDEY